ncbi:hypothetical protein Tco_0419452 [Tanacetum coccineum]
MDGTLYATESDFKNVTGGVVASNTIPGTAICTCVPAHHYWPFGGVTVIACGGKAMFKEKQSFTLLFRALMNSNITQRSGRRSKSGGEKENKKDTQHF